MDPAVQAFNDKWAEKSAAKQESLEATGAARLAEWKADQALTADERAVHEAEAERQWGIVEARGFASGDEGRLYNEALDLAEGYVDSHPELDAMFGRYVTGDSKDQDFLVKLISVMRKTGRDDEADALTMFELARFERRNYTAAMQAVVRTPRHGGRKAEV